MESKAILEAVVRDSIYQYPTLYRAGDYKSSRIFVLNHLFLVIGTGYEWHPDGYLYNGEIEDITLPEDYFQKDLYQVLLKSGSTEEIERELQGTYFYKTHPSYNGEYYIIEGKEPIKKISHLLVDFDWETEGEDNFDIKVHEAVVRSHKRQNMYLAEEESGPYPVSQYSPIKEIFLGRTNSVHIDNFDLSPKLDWLNGAVDVAHWALNYYMDDERTKGNLHHPNRSLSEDSPEKIQERWQKFRENQIEFFKEFIAKYAN